MVSCDVVARVVFVGDDGGVAVVDVDVAYGNACVISSRKTL